MKKIMLTAVFAASASTAQAGALSDPIVEPIVIIQDASSSASHDWLVPVIFLLLLAASLAGSTTVTTPLS